MSYMLEPVGGRRSEESDGRFRGHNVIFFFLFVLGALVPSVRAAAPPDGSPGSAAPTAPQFTIADYDGDSLPDVASVRAEHSKSHDSQYLIEFRLTGGLHEIVGLTGPTGGLHLKSDDVNGDSFPDVVVTSLWTKQPVAVLLNDGKGDFTPTAPSAFPRAFDAPETSLRTLSVANRSAAAEMLARYPSGDCGQCGRDDGPKVISGRLVLSAFHPFASSGRQSYFGRAPPHSASH